MTSQADTLFADVYDLDENFFGTTVDLSPTGAVADTAGVTAVVEVMENELIDQRTGVMTKVQIRTYIIRKSVYLKDAVETAPKKGDVIKETIGGVERKFQCTPYGDLKEVEEEFSDGVRWLIRTKEVLA